MYKNLQTWSFLETFRHRKNKVQENDSFPWWDSFLDLQQWTHQKVEVETYFQKHWYLKILTNVGKLNYIKQKVKWKQMCSSWSSIKQMHFVNDQGFFLLEDLGLLLFFSIFND